MKDLLKEITGEGRWGARSMRSRWSTGWVAEARGGGKGRGVGHEVEARGGGGVNEPAHLIFEICGDYKLYPSCKLYKITILYYLHNEKILYSEFIIEGPT